VTRAEVDIVAGAGGHGNPDIFCGLMIFLTHYLTVYPYYCIDVFFPHMKFFVSIQNK
jgi:hypothetical protein